MLVMRWFESFLNERLSGRVVVILRFLLRLSKSRPEGRLFSRRELVIGYTFRVCVL